MNIHSPTRVHEAPLSNQLYLCLWGGVGWECDMTPVLDPSNITSPQYHWRSQLVLEKRLEARLCQPAHTRHLALPPPGGAAFTIYVPSNIMGLNPCNRVTCLFLPHLFCEVATGMPHYSRKGYPLHRGMCIGKLLIIIYIYAIHLFQKNRDWLQFSLAHC